MTTCVQDCLLTFCNVPWVSVKERQIKKGQSRGMEGEDRREWAVETGRGRAEGGTGRAETESVACVLVPSPVRPLSAGDLWHRDWEQSPLPALYCYYWQLMRPDGLSSTALNRGLHLHESRDLPFPFFPLSSFYFLLHSGSGVPKVCRQSRQRRTGKSMFLLHRLPAACYVSDPQCRS